MKFEKKLAAAHVSEWKTKYVRYKTLKQHIDQVLHEVRVIAQAKSSLMTATGEAGMVDVGVCQCVSLVEFWKVFNEDLRRVNLFYLERITEFGAIFYAAVMRLEKLGLLGDTVCIHPVLSCRPQTA